MKKSIITVIGTPKSGISILAQCLRMLGLTGLDDKARIDITSIHDLLFQEMDHSPAMAGSLPPGWMHTPGTKRARELINALIADCRKENGGFFLAAPFLDRFMPLWAEAFQKAGLAPRFVLMLRHPWEAASSLACEENIDLAKAHRIWLTHAQDALRFCQGHVLITFDQLLADPVSILVQMGKKLNLAWPNDPWSVSSSLLDFVQPSLKHHHASNLPDNVKKNFQAYARLYQEIGRGQWAEMADGNFPDLHLSPELGVTLSKGIISVQSPTSAVPDLVESLLDVIGQYEKQAASRQAEQERIITEPGPSLFARVVFPSTRVGGEIVETIPLIANEWQKISLTVPEPILLKDKPIIFKPLNTNGTVLISSITILNKTTNDLLWTAQNAEEFNQLFLEKTVFRLPDQDKMALLITSDNPCILLTFIKQLPDCPMDIVVWMKASIDQTIVHEYFKTQYELQNQNSELLAQIKELKNNFSSFRNHFDRSLGKKIQNSTKQIEAFMGIQSVLQNGIVLPEMHGWPISSDFALYLINIIRTNDYDFIIEFGSGTSTVLIAQALKQIKSKRTDRPATRQIAFEHLEEYYLKTLSLLQTAHVSDARDTLRLTPLVPYKDPTGEYSYYNCNEALAALSGTFKESNDPPKILMLVDGPPGVTCKNARYPALTHVLPHFSQAKIDILLDDSDRPDEKETVKFWKAHLGNTQIPHRQIELQFEKGACFFQINFDKPK